MSCGSGKDFYQRMQATQTRLLDKYDCRQGTTRALKLIRNAGELNPTSGEFEQAAGESIPLIGVTSNYADRLINEKTILTGDVKLVIDHPVEPLSKDMILIDGDYYRIVNIDKKNAGGVVIGYILQLRK